MKKSNSNINHLPAKRLDQITLNIVVRVGSRNETSQNNGVSHLLEHLIIKKLLDVDGWVRPYFLDSLYGTTHKNRTEYECTLLVDDLQKLAEVIAGITNFSAPTKKEFEAEKQVLIEELLQDEEDEDYSFDRQEESWLYGDNSLGLPIGGTSESIRKLTMPQVKLHHQEFYKSGNITVSVCGDVRSDELQELRQYLPAINSADHFESLVFKPSKKADRLLLNDNKQQVSYSETWFSNLNNFEQLVRFEFCISLLNYYLFYRLRESGLCYSSEVDSHIYPDFVEANIRSWTNGNKLPALRGSIVEVLQDVGGAISEADLGTFRVEYGKSKRLEDAELTAHNLSWYKAFFGEDYSQERVLKIVEQVTMKEIASIIRNFSMHKPGKVVLQGSKKFLINN